LSKMISERVPGSGFPLSTYVFIEHSVATSHKSAVRTARDFAD
jgi:hypothetical protein